MSTEIHIDDRIFVSGLNWRTVMDIAAEKAEISGYAKELAARYYVRIAKEDEVLVGLLPAQKNEKLRGKISVAGAFALVKDVSPEALLFLECKDPEGVILVGLRNGVPFPGFDKFGSRVDMMAVANDFLTLNSTGVSVYSNTRAFPNAIDFDVADLEHADAAKAKLQVLRSFSWTGIAAGFVAVAVATGGAWWWWDSAQREEQARKKSQQQLDPNVAYAKALPSALAQAGVPASMLGREIRAKIGALPAGVAGWALANAECDPSGCQVGWDTAGIGTYASFVKATGNKDMKPGLDGRTLQTAIPFEIAAPALDDQTVPSLTDFMVATGSAFQKWALADWKFAFQEPQVYGAPPGVNATLIRNPVKAGRWQAGGKYWMLDALQALPPNMTVDVLRIKREGNGFTFSCEGKFYVR